MIQNPTLRLFVVLPFTLSLFLFFSAGTQAQISQPGIPWSMVYTGGFHEIPLVEVAKPDMEKIRQEDNHAEKDGSFYRYGRLLPVDIKLSQQGVWDTLNTGGKIWRVKINCPSAQALSLHFSDFHIPPGGKLFIYSADKKQTLGAFTEFNNHPSGIFATRLIYTDEVIVEYNENAEAYGKASFSINGIGYAYRGIYRTNLNVLKEFGDSDDACEVNVNCSPEGDNWQGQKRGVVRIGLLAGANMGWCSGSVINNTAQDCTPYILSADHCGGDASTSEYLQWVFYFNYESPNCINPASEGTLASQTMTGCEVTAKGGQGGTAGSDFHLIRLTNEIPIAYNTYYNGWNRENDGASNGVSIHHPAGDIKKISTFNTPLTTSDWNGSGFDSHWEVTWAATTNGHGVTEGGSSGSPIFNTDGLIVGDLTGGSSYCNTPTATDLYGKMSYSWESNGNLPEEQLKPWLDPVNSGDSILSGREPCGASGIYADFSWTPTVVVTNVPVDFTNESIGNISGYAWTFQGGNPAISSATNPAGVIFSTTGVHQVTLLATGSLGSDTRIKDINVLAPSPPSADFVASATVVYTGDTIDFYDLTTGGPTSWEWTFMGGTPSTVTLQNPTNIVYNNPGTYTVSLSVSNAYGNHYLTKTNYITVLMGNPNVVLCDTISNMSPFDSLVVKDILPWGLLPGHNPYNIKEYADKYANSTFNYITGLVVPVHTAHSSVNSAIIRFKIWEGDTIPTNTLGYKDVYLTNLSTNAYQVVNFDQEINVSGTFFVGYAISYFQSDNYQGPDNVSIFMAGDRGPSAASTLFMKYNHVWYPSKDLSLVNNLHSSLAIEVVACRYTDIEELDKAQTSIRLFPNPSDGSIRLLSDKPNEKIDHIEVYTIAGQVIQVPIERIGINHLQIEMSSHEAGVYFIRFEAGGDVLVRKVTLMK